MGHEPGNRYFAVPDRCGDLIEIAPGGVTAADHRHQEQSRDRASLTRPFANTAHDLSCRDAVPIVKCRQSTGVQKLVGKGDLPKGGCHALAHKQCGDTFTQSAYDGVVFRHHHQPASLARGRKNSLIVQLRLPRIVCRTQPSSPKPVGRKGGPGIPWSAFLRPSNGEFAGKPYVFVAGEKMEKRNERRTAAGIGAERPTQSPHIFVGRSLPGGCTRWRPCLTSPPAGHPLAFQLGIHLGTRHPPSFDLTFQRRPLPCCSNEKLGAASKLVQMAILARLLK